MKLKHINNEQEFDWGRASPDYAKYRSGYPESFYEVLAALEDSFMTGFDPLPQDLTHAHLAERLAGAA